MNVHSIKNKCSRAIVNWCARLGRGYDRKVKSRHLALSNNAPHHILDMQTRDAEVALNLIDFVELGWGEHPVGGSRIADRLRR